MAHVIGSLAGTFFVEGDYARAVEYQSRSVRLWQTVGASHILNQARIFLAQMKSDLGYREESVTTIRQVLADFRADGKRTAAAGAEGTLGIVLLFGGQFDEAQALFTSAAAYYKRASTYDGAELGMRRMWCSAALHLGQYEELLRECQQLDKSYLKHEAKFDLAQTSWLQGCAELALDRLPKAAALLSKSVAAHRPLHFYDQLGWVLSASASAQLLTGDAVAARRELREALQLAVKVRILASVSMALPAASLLLVEGGQVERAIALYALASCDPYVANSRWFATVYGRRIQAAAASLPADKVAAAQAQGQSWEVWQAVEALQQQLADLEA